MDSESIRRAFLEFFEQRGHRVVASASLVPDDPTLLFTNAGMVQFKDAFLGLESRPYSRAASVQRCMRVSGKHNDLENVGPSPRHHTFFEMLGNFSFGDYFKRDAIGYAWRFMTETMGVPADRLVVTVFRNDGDALAAWRDDVGLPPETVLRMGAKTNFWMMADTGPCGPTSEIHYDFGPDRCTCGRPDCSVALDNGCDRWLEVWNLVFMEKDRLPDGTERPLPQTGVDTGMGLERLAAVMQGVDTNYETDLFAPILDRVQQLRGHDDEDRRQHQTGYRVLADHSRAMAFLVADGVLPANDGRGYVLRLIMRRAMRYGKLVGFDGPFLADVVTAAVDTLGGAHPLLVERADWIRRVVSEEEARFERTLLAGMTILDGVIAEATGAGSAEIEGGDVFRLYDTYGFPPDLTRAVAEEHGLGIDRSGFDRLMDRQRERARAGGTFAVSADSEQYRRLGVGGVQFLGYADTAAVARVVALGSGGEPLSEAGEGSAVEVVLDRTPFYAESGGQVGDVGALRGPDVEVHVTDTRSPAPGLVVHHGVVASGVLRSGGEVRAEVDAERRLDIMRNHTATHLLHRALQEVLGGHAQQRGSLVAPDRLRFDFAHLAPLTAEELDAVERRVNEMVREDAPVAWDYMPIDDARRTGATMLFGEKYGDTVRVVSVDGISRELCGGTHVSRTGQIGSLVVVAESSVGAGLRRIEALTGRGAEAHVRARLALVDEAARRLRLTSPEEVLGRIDELVSERARLERELARAVGDAAEREARDLVRSVVDVSGVPVVFGRVAATSTESLRSQADVLRAELGTAVVVLGAVIDGSPRLVAAVTDDLVRRGLHAGRIVKDVASAVGGGGGGKPTIAEAGGRDAGALDAALAGVPDVVAAMVTA